jgi:hypothetical protein
MICKIIGFLITKNNKTPLFDFFNVGLNLVHLSHGSYNIYLWGIGDIESYKIEDKYSLSFPIHSDLLDRNVLISLENDNIVVENDWLGAIPVFYNTKDKIVSTLSNCCLVDKTIHDEGLADYCEFGYSVFEQTIFKDVKFMRYFSKLTISSNSIDTENKNDPVLDESFLEKVTDEDNVIKLMQNYISEVEKNTSGDIILPTSGGYDSRMLNYLVKNKKRIKSFTYGISKNQSLSAEVVYAKKISEIYNTQWEQIELNEYHKYMDNWASIYGFSTHLHGMYHIEFYKKILQKYRFVDASFLSGIIGDAWAKYGKFKSVNTYLDVINLGYTHGLNLNVKFIELNNRKTNIKNFFNMNKVFLQNEKIKSVYAMRIKIMLISYLAQIPEYFGIPVWTPFLNFKIVKATLNIPDNRRRNRAWQKTFFKKVGLDLENMHLKSISSNKLDYETAKGFEFENIDVNIMKKYINEDRLVQINDHLSDLSSPEFDKNNIPCIHKLWILNIYEYIKNQILFIPKVGGVLRLLGFRNHYLKAIQEYYVIRSIERGLKYDS